LTKRVHPVLIPQQPKQFCVKCALKDLDVKLVVLVCVDAEILDLRERDRLVLGFSPATRGWGVVLRISAEGTDVDLSSGNSAVGIDLGGMVDDEKERIRKKKIERDRTGNTEGRSGR
jgi:hypothetical protein